MKNQPLEHDRYYHIFNRGNNKENIFLDHQDYLHFLKLLKQYLHPICEIYSYCLLRNHYHFILKIKEQNEIQLDLRNKSIPQSFSNFFNAYVKSFNKKYNRRGSLFQKHMKKNIIENTDYLKTAIAYVNTNPTHHGIGDYSTYVFSSFSALFGNSKTLVNRDYVLDLFGGRENLQYCLDLKCSLLDEFED